MTEITTESTTPKNPLAQTGKTAHKRLEELRTLYASDQKNNTFNALIYGDSGTGKTRLLDTCRKPVLVHSFDPGGTKTIRTAISKGSIIVDTRFEQENKLQPDTFRLWEKEVMSLYKEKVFETLGTFALDSMTLWFEALQKEVMRINKIDQLRIQDWGTIYNTVRDWINWLCALPCDVIITGHIDIDKDEVTGKNETTLLLAGASKRKIPIFFDEMYVAISKPSPTGPVYSLLTQSDGYYKAKTRLGGGVFLKQEEPNIKKMLAKIGYPTEDK